MEQLTIAQMEKRVDYARTYLNENHWQLMRALERAGIDIMELARALRGLA